MRKTKSKILKTWDKNVLNKLIFLQYRHAFGKRFFPCKRKETERVTIHTTGCFVLLQELCEVILFKRRTQNFCLLSVGRQPARINQNILGSYKLVTRIYCVLDYMVYEAVLKSVTFQQPGCLASQDWCPVSSLSFVKIIWHALETTILLARIVLTNMINFSSKGIIVILY